jgi:hypothetical protein
MPGDGIVSLGATFDKTNVDAGLGDTAEMTKAAMEGITISITEANAKSKAAWKSLSDEVKTSAANVNAEALKVAESSRAVAAAQLDVRRAVTLTRDANIPAAESMSYLAAAQMRLAESQAATAAAVKANLEGIAAASHKAALSAVPMATAWEAAGVEIKASLTGIQEKLVQTAETSKLSAAGMTAGFAGLSSLLGAGLVAGFAAHFVDETAKMVLELDHLHEKTGITVRDLSGLQEVVKEQGGDWEQVSTGLIRMDRAMGEVREGNEATIKGFKDLGVSFDEVEKLTPIEMLKRLSVAFAEQHDATIRDAAAIAIFGRGGAALVPILIEQAGALGVNIEKGAQLAKVDDDAVRASKEWTKAMADFSAEIRGPAIWAMENLENVVMGVVGVWDIAAAGMVTAFEGPIASIMSLNLAASGLGRIIGDVVSGHLDRIRQDFNDTKDSVLDNFKDISNSWKQVFSDFTGVDMKAINGQMLSLSSGDMKANAAPGAPASAYANQASTGKSKGSKGSGGSSAFQQDEEDLNELKLSHQVTLEEEIKFWQERLATAKKGTTEYREIVAKLAPLEQKEDRKPGTEVSSAVAGASAELATEAMNEQAQLTSALAIINKAESDSAKHAVEVAKEALEEKMRLAHEDLVDFEQACKNKVQLGQMTEKQMIAAIEQATRQEQQIRHQASAAIRQLDAGDVKAYAADLKKEEADTREFTRKITQLHQQAATQFQTGWNKAMNQFNSGFMKAMDEVITKSKSLSQAFAQMFNQMLMDLINFVAKWLLQHAEMWAEQKIMDALGLTTKKAAESAANVASTESYTAVAAMAAASAVAGIPITGPALAAAAAAQMTDLGQGFTAMAAFEAGGIVGGGNGMAIPILAHAGERVLSPSQTTNFEKMVNQSNSSSSSASSVIHNHLTQNLNGYDRAGLKSALRDHADDVLAIVRQGYRSGKLSPA